MWKNFTQSEKDFYSNVRMRTTNKSEDTYGKKMAHYVLPTDEQKDFEKNRIISHISNCINFDPANTHLYPELEFQKKNKQLIREHFIYINEKNKQIFLKTIEFI